MAPAPDNRSDEAPKALSAEEVNFIVCDYAASVQSVCVARRVACKGKLQV